MGLFESWKQIATQHDTQKDFKKFWQKYSDTEKRIYEDILKDITRTFEGKIEELATKYETSEELFMGFLDGINNSLKEPLELEKLTSDDFINLDIDFEKLYYNMLDAKADYLFNLPQWDDVLDREIRKEITKKQRRSKTIINENKIGRNEPCPCGSGKKYKKCCGR